MTDSVDVSILGAGAAGPVIAARLREDTGLRVAIFQAGAEAVSDIERMQREVFSTSGCLPNRPPEQATALMHHFECIQHVLHPTTPMPVGG